MPSRQRSGVGRTSNTWRARVKLLGVSHYLGSYPTKKEAIAAEEAFRKEKWNEEYYNIWRARNKAGAKLRWERERNDR